MKSRIRNRAKLASGKIGNILSFKYRSCSLKIVCFGGEFQYWGQFWHRPYARSLFQRNTQVWAQTSQGRVQGICPGKDDGAPFWDRHSRVVSFGHEYLHSKCVTLACTDIPLDSEMPWILAAFLFLTVTEAMYHPFSSESVSAFQMRPCPPYVLLGLSLH